MDQQSFFGISVCTRWSDMTTAQSVSSENRGYPGWYTWCLATRYVYLSCNHWCLREDDNKQHPWAMSHIPAQANEINRFVWNFLYRIGEETAQSRLTEINEWFNVCTNVSMQMTHEDCARWTSQPAYWIQPIHNMKRLLYYEVDNISRKQVYNQQVERCH